MIVIRPQQQAGTAGKAGSQFTGDVYPYLTEAVDGVTINTVTFTPGARTHWHAHESGQILLVLSGRGLVCSESGAVEAVYAGDTIWTPAGESHWHGAAQDSAMTHLAISLGPTLWADAVTPEDYQGANREATP